MLGFLPEEADLSIWGDFGTLTNGQLEIRRSKVHRIIGSYELGRGLFACRDFAQNEIITVYGGELITSDEARLRKQDMSTQSRRYLMRISDSSFSSTAGSTPQGSPTSRTLTASSCRKPRTRRSGCGLRTDGKSRPGQHERHALVRPARQGRAARAAAAHPHAARPPADQDRRGDPL